MSRICHEFVTAEFKNKKMYQENGRKTDSVREKIG
jgi:hypothetical protein